MVKVHRASKANLKGRAGYGVKYVANLEEAFVILNPTTMGVNETYYNLDEGDVVVVEPGEWHWFETPKGDDVNIIAVKLPNLMDDKIEAE
jgi:mannose-6-phosphate isomerase-like protein (cupin superfamily)